MLNAQVERHLLQVILRADDCRISIAVFEKLLAVWFGGSRLSVDLLY